MKYDVVRIAVIGLGDRGRTALRLLGTIPEAVITCLCDLSEANVQAARQLVGTASCEVSYGAEAYLMACHADNVDLAIEILKEARSILCENGWADMDNMNYKSNDAQTLKEEIDEYIKQLEEQKEQQQQDPPPDGDGGGGGSGDDPDDGGGDDDNDESDPNEDLLDQLDDIMESGQYDRSDLDEEKEYYNYEYYGGKSW